MSDAETSQANAGGNLAWTEEAKYQFLLRIVAQLRESKPINWSRINMPGRTTKSLQNMWTKINKLIADLEKEQENGNTTALSTPTKKARKPRTPKSKAAAAEGDDLDEKTPKSTPKKRGSADTSPSKKAKKLKTEDNDEPIKSESDSLENEI